MKNKTLLTESEIRKFMKFANLQPLAENFVTNNSSDTLEETEETVTEEVLAEEEVDVTDLVTALMDVIEDKTGVKVSVEAAAADEMDPMAGEEEEEADMEPSPETADDMDAEGEMPSLEPDAADDDMAPAPSAEEEEDMMMEMINKVTSRVAARLLKENKK